MQVVLVVRGTACVISIRDAITSADVSAETERSSDGGLAHVLHKLSPLAFVEFALQRDHALERVAPAIGAAVVRHRDLEMREWVLPPQGVKADRHRRAGRKR